MSKPILCVDFDGVIHSYTSGWKGAAIVSDPPTKGALKWLWKATEWFDVQVYSSRSKEPLGVEAMTVWLIQWSALEFGPDHPMSSLPDDPANYPLSFPTQKPAAFLTIDDRAICFEGIWEDMEPADLLSFKPWNKRPLGATGRYPQGVLDAEDEGELQMGVAFDPAAGVVRLAFGKPVAWLGLPPNEARALANALLKHAGSA